MVVRLYVVAGLAFGCLLLGGSGLALAGDSYGGQSDDSYASPDGASAPDASDHSGAADDGAAVPQEDEGAASPDDSGGDDAAAPPQTNEPE